MKINLLFFKTKFDFYMYIYNKFNNIKLFCRIFQ